MQLPWHCEIVIVIFYTYFVDTIPIVSRCGTTDVKESVGTLLWVGVVPRVKQGYPRFKARVSLTWAQLWCHSKLRCHQMHCTESDYLVGPWQRLRQHARKAAPPNICCTELKRCVINGVSNLWWCFSLMTCADVLFLLFGIISNGRIKHLLFEDFSLFLSDQILRKDIVYQPLSSVWAASKTAESMVTSVVCVNNCIHHNQSFCGNSS